MAFSNLAHQPQFVEPNDDKVSLVLRMARLSAHVSLVLPSTADFNSINSSLDDFERKLLAPCPPAPFNPWHQMAMNPVTMPELPRAPNVPSVARLHSASLNSSPFTAQPPFQNCPPNPWDKHYQIPLSTATGSPMPRSNYTPPTWTAPDMPDSRGLNDHDPMHAPDGHALQDYQMQLMLLERQNRKRLQEAKGEMAQDRQSEESQSFAPDTHRPQHEIHSRSTRPEIDGTATTVSTGVSQQAGDVRATESPVSPVDVLDKSRHREQVLAREHQMRECQRGIRALRLQKLQEERVNAHERAEIEAAVSAEVLSQDQLEPSKCAQRVEGYPQTVDETKLNLAAKKRPSYAVLVEKLISKNPALGQAPLDEACRPFTLFDTKLLGVLHAIVGTLVCKLSVAVKNEKCEELSSFPSSHLLEKLSTDMSNLFVELCQISRCKIRAVNTYKMVRHEDIAIERAIRDTNELELMNKMYITGFCYDFTHLPEEGVARLATLQRMLVTVGKVLATIKAWDTGLKGVEKRLEKAIGNGNSLPKPNVDNAIQGNYIDVQAIDGDNDDDDFLVVSKDVNA